MALDVAGLPCRAVPGLAVQVDPCAAVICVAQGSIAEAAIDTLSQLVVADFGDFPAFCADPRTDLTAVLEVINRAIGAHR